MNKKMVDELRGRHPGCLLLLSTPTGHVLVGEDATAAAPVLGVLLKQRTRGGPKIEIPQKNLEESVRALLGAGHKVAVCDQAGVADLVTPVARAKMEPRGGFSLPLVATPFQLRVVQPPEETKAEDEVRPAQAATTAPVTATAKKGPDLKGRLLLPCRLKVLSMVASKGASRYAMTGVRLLRVKGGYQAQATDGRIAVWVEGGNVNPGSAADPETLQTALRHESDAGEAIIPASDWEKGMRQDGKAPYAGVSLGRQKSGIAVNGSLLVADNVEGRWPDIKGIVPKCPPLVTIDLSPHHLERLCKVWKALGAQRIRLHVFRPNLPVGLFGLAESGEAVSGLIHPLT